MFRVSFRSAVCLLCVASTMATAWATTTTSTTTTTPPSDNPRATYQSWDVFQSATGPNQPDRGLFNPNGMPQLMNTENTAFITSSRNIYSFMAPIAPVVSIPNYGAADATWTTLFVDVNTLGRRLDLGSVNVNGHLPQSVTLNNSAVVHPLPTGHSEGGSADIWSFMFQIPGNALSYDLSLRAGGTSMSLASLAVSTIYTTDANPIGGQGARFPFDSALPGTPQVGDADAIGGVTRADLATLVQNLGRGSGAAWTDGDFNLDGAVGLSDLALLQRQPVTYGGVAWAPAQGIPEPGTMTLAGTIAAGAWLLCSARHRRTR